ncbi:putative rRNA-processing protein EBP2 [Tetrabaena socialis]|uniref:Putative rRNA-processing protein EBP2 n=1 Tax=Tetrabaena socialis TaxID=47790 RepID=A0A2J8AFT2_9CHLO|nr:putative rRNA-processing protein EBP2 [Tetrabaena socialis]|eukprot:PNH11380.1 putative rRNA-processing protein EBP2 [Tetrabaena socialis]
MGNKRRKVESEEEESEDELEEEYEPDDEDADDEEGGEAGPSGREERPAIYNVEALHDKLEDIGWDAGLAWDETLVLTTDAPTAVPNVEDDLARELAFYSQALSGAQVAIRRFEEAGTPWLRPLDYYAEMVKTDNHMAKVKKQLMFEQQQIEAAEERRKQREAKQYGKQVQAAKVKERGAEKKRQITEISKLRKQREKSGFEGELNMDDKLAEMDHKRRPMNIKQLGQRSSNVDSKAPNKKRQMRDSKFGFGGRKALGKQNDAFSAASTEDYKPGGFKDHFGPRKGGVQKRSGGGPGGGGAREGGRDGPREGGGGSRGKGGKKPTGRAVKAQRPGKERRKSMAGGRGGKGGKRAVKAQRPGKERRKSMAGGRGGKGGKR